MSIIKIIGKALVPEGEYQIRCYDGRVWGAVSKTLRKGDLFTKVYHYALFRNGGDGYVVKRKERNIPETEQLWADVCELTPCAAS